METYTFSPREECFLWTIQHHLVIYPLHNYICGKVFDNFYQEANGPLRSPEYQTFYTDFLTE